MRPFIWYKNWGVRGDKQKTSQNEPKNQFFGPILPICLEYNKNCQIFDALHYIALLVNISNQSDIMSERGLHPRNHLEAA